MSEPATEQDLTLLATGARFAGRYEVVRCIKTGGMGAVYEVIHAETRRRAALKVMLPSIVGSADMRARFKLEMTVAADIESEHIVEIYDAGVDEAGTPYIVMELLRGRELSQIFIERGRLPPDEAVVYLWQVALALDKTHAAGVVHRDLKPDNLFITARDDGSPRLKILDFGIAKVVARDPRAAKQTLAVGTPLYMSPEHIRGDPGIGPPTDIYALGHIAYELVVGEAYWEDLVERSEQLYSVLLEIGAGAKEPAAARARRRRGLELPEAFDAWFARATALAPEDRYQRASDLVAGFAEAFGVAVPRPSGPLSHSGVFAPPAPSGSGREPSLSGSGREPAPLRVSVGALAFDEPSTSGGVASLTAPVPPWRSRLPVFLAAGAGVGMGILVAIALVLRAGQGGGARPDKEPAAAGSAIGDGQPSAAPGSRPSSAVDEPRVEPSGAPSASSAPAAAEASAKPPAGDPTAAQPAREKPAPGGAKPPPGGTSKPAPTAKPGPPPAPKDPLDVR